MTRTLSPQFITQQKPERNCKIGLASKDIITAYGVDITNLKHVYYASFYKT